METLTKLAAAITILFLITGVRTDELGTTAESPEMSVLCVSECGTCPTICTSPPPPPPSQTTTPSPPEVLTPTIYRPPPPMQTDPFVYTPSTPSQTKEPPPPPGSDKKGNAAPYYYFYTSDATRVFGGVSSFCSLFFAVFFILTLALI